MKTKYQLIVSNIGCFDYTNKKEAFKDYNEYVGASKSNYGRASGEDVTLIESDNTIKEHFGFNNLYND